MIKSLFITVLAVFLSTFALNKAFAQSSSDESNSSTEQSIQSIISSIINGEPFKIDVPGNGNEQRGYAPYPYKNDENTYRSSDGNPYTIDKNYKNGNNYSSSDPYYYGDPYGYNGNCGCGEKGYKNKRNGHDNGFHKGWDNGRYNKHGEGERDDDEDDD